MSMQVLFLGTAASVPTVKRSLPAVLAQREGEQLMFDCGEGVQRQMIIARRGFHKKMKVFISHMHGDHILGLPGLLQTMAMLNRERKLDIYGPPGITLFLEGVRESTQFGLTFPVEIHEIENEGVICNEKEYTVQAARGEHLIPNLAYAFIEKPRPGKFFPRKAEALGVPEGPFWSKLQQGRKVKLPDGRSVKPEDVMGEPRGGRKIAYSGDTRPCRSVAKLAKDADLLIHEGTLGSELADRAVEEGHSTPRDAAKIARRAKVKKLVLTHISARYEDTSRLLEEAQKIFKNTIIAEDFLKIEIPLPKD
jgi:ribonuclease Z